jgi:hypothetical protein
MGLNMGACIHASEKKHEIEEANKITSEERQMKQMHNKVPLNQEILLFKKFYSMTKITLNF